MDVGTLLSAVQTLFAALQCPELKELLSISSYKSEIETLQHTVHTIETVLRDAELKQMEFDRSEQEKLWIKELKDAVYDADDLVDEFVTLAKQKKLVKGGNVSQKVNFLLSQFNFPSTARKMSKGVKEIRKRLDAIYRNHKQFGFKMDCQCIRKRREETCSYVYTQDIIGRQVELDTIVGRLVDHNVQQNVSCLSIVGIGGLGKTALAQLISNDPRIEQAFPLRLWTCISDEKNWDLKSILCKILESAGGRNKCEDISMDPLQRQVRAQVAGNKYLLVLDDVWTEDRHDWTKLMDFLRGGLRGSSVLVTTRSRITATIVGGEIHDLQGLSDEDSWLLFERTAFGQDIDQATRLELDPIGQEIVKKCANVPLAIRVVGSALYGQDKCTWLSFQEAGLGRINKQVTNGIEPVLKLSYLHLEPELKICFTYCALFPKDYEIRKDELIELWIAQGYVVPSYGGKSLEDVAEEYFLILLRRCFFQDVEKNEDTGEIGWFKMHDLMHDIAQQVAGNGVPKYDSILSDMNNETRHLFHRGRGGGTKSLFTGTKIRTYLRVGLSEPESPKEFGKLLAKWESLRALDLSRQWMSKLPSALGDLVHLRFLDLSCNYKLEVLPNSIVKLHNLQFLHLIDCAKLKELPNGLGKLIDLRVLDTQGCNSLSHMPKSMGKLSSLWKLPYFVVSGGTSNNKDGVQLVKQVKELKALQNLKGKLKIEIKINTDAKYVMEKGGNGGCLSQHLTQIEIRFPRRDAEDVRRRDCEIDEALLEDLQPHPNLQHLDLKWYCGGRMPNWGREENLTTSLPNLVSISLHYCHKLQHLSGLGKLPNLKDLELFHMDELEYIENRTIKCGRGGAPDSQQSFFPSLERLELYWLPKLKGWWRPRDDTNSNSNSNQEENLTTFLPNLVFIKVYKCDKVQHLSGLGKLPKLKDLELWDMDELEYIENTTIKSGRGAALESQQSFFPALETLDLYNLRNLKGWWRPRDDTNSNSNQQHALLLPSFSRLSQLEVDGCPNLASLPLCPSVEHLTLFGDNENLWIIKSIESEISKLLRSVSTDNVRDLLKVLQPMEAFQRLTSMIIVNDKKVEKLSEVEEVFRRCSSSLSSLKIEDCSELKSVSGGLEHLTALETLVLDNLDNLRLGKEGEGEEEEEDGMVWSNLQHSLRSLELRNLPKMVKLPNGMRNVTALQSLQIRDCKQLESLPEWIPELTSLKQLHILGCTEAQEERCSQNTGEDWSKIQQVPDLRISRGPW